MLQTRDHLLSPHEHSTQRPRRSRHLDRQSVARWWYTVLVAVEALTSCAMKEERTSPAPKFSPQHINSIVCWQAWQTLVSTSRDAAQDSKERTLRTCGFPHIRG